jgi:hypothetical protein
MQQTWARTTKQAMTVSRRYSRFSSAFVQPRTTYFQAEDRSVGDTQYGHHHQTKKNETLVLMNVTQLFQLIRP